jgi:hypothetical protein
MPPFLRGDLRCLLNVDVKVLSICPEQIHSTGL